MARREHRHDSRELRACLDREVGPGRESRCAYPDVDGHAADEPDGDLHLGHDGAAQGHQQQPLQAVRDRHRRVQNTGLDRDDIGYACMPLFHSNSMFVGLMPCFWVGGSMGLRERFSGSRFVPDCFEYGVSMLELRGRAGALRAGGDRDGARRRPGAHPPRGDREPEEPAALRGRQRRVARRHRQVHVAGWASRTCSSCTARPRPRSAPCAAWATRAAASARSPIRRCKILREHGSRVRARRARRRGQDHELRRGGGRDLPLRARHRAVPGLLRQPRREQLEVPRRRVPLGRPRPRARAQRQALPVLRRPHRRLDPQGRRELLGAAGRAHARPSTRTCRSPPPTACRAPSPTSS